MASLLKQVANRNDARGADGGAPRIGIHLDLGGGQFAYVVAAGASLGHFREFDISEWVSTSDGKVWRFEGVCEDIEAASCHNGLLTLPPGLFMRCFRAVGVMHAGGVFAPPLYSESVRSSSPIPKREGPRHACAGSPDTVPAACPAEHPE